MSEWLLEFVQSLSEVKIILANMAKAVKMRPNAKPLYWNVRRNEATTRHKPLSSIMAKYNALALVGLIVIHTFSSPLGQGLSLKVAHEKQGSKFLTE